VVEDHIIHIVHVEEIAFGVVQQLQDIHKEDNLVIITEHMQLMDQAARVVTFMEIAEQTLDQA
jgi:hypothetical protein